LPIESVEPSTVSMSLIYLFPRRSPDRALAAMSVPLAAPVWTFDHHFDVMSVEVWR
jgi:hypothetical protein